MLRLPLLLLALAPAWSDPLDQHLVTAEKQLRSGLVRQASSGFRRYLEGHPNSGRAKIGLAAALSSSGGCDEALAMLDEIRSRRAWDARAASIEASCLHRAGDLAGAYAAYEEAIWYAPKDTNAWIGLAMVAASWGDLGAAEDTIDQLLLLRHGEIFAAVVAAQLAYAGGDADLDQQLAELRSVTQGVASAKLHLLDAMRWLDLDDPRSADEVLVAAIRQDLNNGQLAAWRAEAARRLGDTQDARFALDRPLVRQLRESALGIAIEARVLVDEGELSAAEALLALHPDPADPEALASSWYLATARGDTAEADALAAGWRRVVQVPEKRLEHLVPVTMRNNR